MKNQSELFFLDADRFGQLSYYNIYCEYEQPLIFTAKNEYGHLFFCYSLGYEGNLELWLLIPSSETIINSFELKELSILEMIKHNKGKNVFILKNNIDIQSASVIVDELSVTELCSNFLLPENDVFISENINVDNTRKHSHKIRISTRKNKADIDSGILNQVTEALTKFCADYLKIIQTKVSFFPQDAIIGSFVYRIKTEVDKKSGLTKENHAFLSEVNEKNKFLEQIKKSKFNLKFLKNLFSLIIRHKVNIEFIDENSTNIIFNITPDYAEEMLPEIDKQLLCYLDSTMVPQADKLEVIKKFSEIMNEKSFVTSDDLGLVKRQESYYRDAVKILGLINNYQTLTPLGRKVANSKNSQEWIGLLRRQFEETDCGYMWMLTQNVNSILDIDENTASDFIMSNCTGLSESTSKRRAQTLKAWVRKFKEFS